jgi:hypothetical protein
MARMSCDQYRDEMLLSLGQPVLPEELRAHMESCAACREEYAMLTKAARHLGDDTLFQIDSTAQDELLSRIEERITVAAITDIRPHRWLRYAAAVAAVFVLGIVGLYSTMNFSNNVTTGPTASVEAPDSVVYSLTDAAYDLGTTEDDLASGDVGVLLGDFVSQAGGQGSDSLLGGISEDEMKYLQENLKVGDLL